MKSRRLAAVAAVLAAAIAGCGSSPAPRVTGSHHAPARAVQCSLPLESACTPDGARPAAPPQTFGISPSEIHIGSNGLHLIEQFEGYMRCAYWDAYGKVWTAGYGQTKGVYGGFCFASRAAAEQNLKRSVESEYQWAVRGLDVDLNQNEIDALDSFAYNLGAGIFVGALRRDLQHREFHAAAAVMRGYDHAGGVLLPGLATRRRLETELLLRRPAGPSRAQIKRRLDHDYRYRRHLRRVLEQQHCRVADPSAHCRGVLRNGRLVNQAIRRIHSTYHVY